MIARCGTYDVAMVSSLVLLMRPSLPGYLALVRASKSAHCYSMSHAGKYY